MFPNNRVNCTFNILFSEIRSFTLFLFELNIFSYIWGPRNIWVAHMKSNIGSYLPQKAVTLKDKLKLANCRGEDCPYIHYPLHLSRPLMRKEMRRRWMMQFPDKSTTLCCKIFLKNLQLRNICPGSEIA